MDRESTTNIVPLSYASTSRSSRMFRGTIFSIILLLSGCAAVPFKDIKQGDVDNLAYSVAQLIEYRKQPQWLSPIDIMDRGWGDCKGKAVVSCYIINQWPNWACWYDFPNKRHVRAKFYDFSTARMGYIDDAVFWE